MVTGIIAFIQMLPKILELMSRLGVWMTNQNLDKWLSELEVSIDQLEKAKLPDEKLKAAQSIVDSMRKLGP